MRLREGLAGLPAVVRAVDDAGVTLASLEIQAPSLDDVFLAKTGRSLEGAGGGRVRRGRADGVSNFWSQVGSARVALGRPHEPSARGGRLPADLPDAAAARELGRPEGVDAAARLPDRLLPRVRARGPVHPGRALLDDERGHRSRQGHPDGLPEPALADVDARCRADRRPARRRGRPRPHPGCVLHRRRTDRRRPLRGGRARDPHALRLRRRDLDQLRRPRRLPRAPHRLGRGDPGPLPAPLRLSLSLLDEHAAGPDRRRLVPLRRERESRSRT